MRARVSVVVAVMAVLSSVAAFSQASEKSPQLTMIVVKDMHCASCAKKIATKLYGVSGVFQVRADVAKNATYVAPAQQKNPSPRKLWEAVETAGFKPIKLVGPSGVFTSKPAQ